MPKSLEDLTHAEALELLRQREADMSELELMRQISGTPEGRHELQKLVKKVKPDLVIPEYDARIAAESAVASTKEEVEALKKQILEDKLRRELEEQRQKVAANHGLTADEVLAVEKIMVDEHIGSYDTAAKYYKAQRQAAAPTNVTSVNPEFEMPDKNIWGGAIHNEAARRKIARTQAWEALQSMRSGKPH